MSDVMSEFRPRLFVSLSDLPEAREWKVGEVYFVKAKVIQKSLTEEGVSFEVVDIRPTDGDPTGRSKKQLQSDSGTVNVYQ